MPYVITEQGDLGLGLDPIDEKVYNESVSKDNEDKDKKDDK